MQASESEHRVNLTPCYILHQRPYRETSVLLDVFSREFGRISLVARGCKRKNSKTGGILRAFTPLVLSWQGRGELKNLSDADQVASMLMLQGKALFCGLYLNELLLYLLYPSDAHPELYDRYAATLQKINSSEMLDVDLRYFELTLLDLLGYAPDLLYEVTSGEPVEPARFYRYQLERGIVELKGDENGALSGASLIAFSQYNLSDDRSRSDAKRLMRQLLNHHLDGRELKSRRVFSQPRPSVIPDSGRQKY